MSGYLKIDHNSLIALGNYIRSHRINKNIGLREMATRIGISNAYLSNLESGKHSKANPLLLKKIAEELKIDHLTLFKIIGYTNQDISDIQNDLLNDNRKTTKKELKMEKMVNYMRKFSEEEFELVEKYLELIIKK
ncbi:MAG: helix-turn-helix transcriptional regulator [Psychrilyobacter sp.]|uniref:helix-turn-helix domain-containing protein n=1 Tax=Psychrilyobacter sp. TaxID=2586924 RepID=UPI003C75BF76